MKPLPTRVDLPRTVRLPAGVIPPIPPPHALAHAARADGERHDLAARRVRVLLSGTRGVERVEGDGVPLAGRLGVEGAAGANLVVGPRGARRECFGPAGSILESVQLPDALPGILVQWRAQSPGGSVPLRLTAVLLPPADAPAAGSATLRFHAAPGLLWVARGDAGVLLCVPGAGAVPEIRTRDGEILLDWDLSFGSPRAPLTLLLQAAPPEGVWPALTALAGATAHHRRGEAASMGDGEPGVLLEAGVEEMDSGVRWIRAWTRDRLLTVPGVAPGMHGPPASSRSGAGGLSDAPVVHLPGEAAGWLLPGSEAAWLVMGSAVSGDWEAGRAALSGLGWDSPRVALLSALALARWTAWTGEARPLVEHGPQLAAVLAPHGLPDGVEPEVVTEIRRAVTAAAEAAEATGAAMSVLQESGEPPATRNAPGTPGGGRRLPVVGARAGAVPPLVLRPGREGVPVEVRLREALEVRDALGVVARAPEVLGTGMGPAVLHGLVAGMLGASPDAPYGRLTLSPLLPPNWNRFRVRGIRAGEGALDLGYQRDGGHVRWTLQPQEGSVPLMVVFEPWQPVTGVRALWVDGAPAELDVVEEGGWSRVKIQIPADGVRVVELEGTTEGRP